MKNIILLLIALFSVLSCSQTGKTELNQDEIDSSLYLNEDIKIGDSISTLLKKNIILSDIKYSSTYHLVDHSYYDINFDEADVCDDDTVRCLVYKYTPQNLADAKEKYNQITSYFYRKVGTASIDTSYSEKEEGIPKTLRYHDTTWIKDNKKFFVSFMTHDWLFDNDSYFLMLLIERDDKKY